MTVKELKAELEKYNEDFQVVHSGSADKIDFVRISYRYFGSSNKPKTVVEVE